MQEQTLNSFHTRCLRRILNIKWSDEVPNVEVLARAWLPRDVYAAETMQAVLAVPNGRRPDSKGHPVRRASLWYTETFWPTQAAL